MINDVMGKIEAVESSILERFSENRPLLIAWSGGKDSNVLASLCLNVAVGLRKRGISHPPIIVTTADTLIENPEIAAYVKKEMEKMRAYGKTYDIDLTIACSRPSLLNRWAINIIGKGQLPTFYDSKHRECTIDTKVKPMQILRKKILANLSGTYAEPVTLIGTRFQESESRSRRMKQRGELDVQIWKGKDGLLYQSPLSFWSEEEIWLFLDMCHSGQIESYSDFDDTFRLYKDSSSDS